MEMKTHSVGARVEKKTATVLLSSPWLRFPIFGNHHNCVVLSAEHFKWIAWLFHWISRLAKYQSHCYFIVNASERLGKKKRTNSVFDKHCWKALFVDESLEYTILSENVNHRFCYLFLLSAGRFECSSSEMHICGQRHCSLNQFKQTNDRQTSSTVTLFSSEKNHFIIENVVLASISAFYEAYGWNDILNHVEIPRNRCHI